MQQINFSISITITEYIEMACSIAYLLIFQHYSSKFMFETDMATIMSSISIDGQLKIA